MTSPAFLPVICADVSLQDETLFSHQYQDHYYSGDPLSQDGRAETDYVFIDANHLAERFKSLPENGFFVIGETGFGSGLNFFRAVECFLEHAPASSRLFFYSSEKHPLNADIFHAIQQRRHWLPDALKQPFSDFPIPATPGFHQRHFCDGRIRLCLLYGDSNLLWPQTQLQCDAWFLDGFAPGKNPDMWQDTLFLDLAKRSKPGTTLSTFTAAGFVRRALLNAGFTATRQKGFGQKREMLVANIPGEWQPSTLTAKRIAVIGAGLAGCTVARALAELGCDITLHDPHGIAQGASGNIAGILYSSASDHFTEQNRFYQSSFFHALEWMHRSGFPSTPQQGALNGVWHFPKNERFMERTRKSADAGYWPDNELVFGEHANRDGYCFTRAGYISPPLWCQHLASHPNIRLTKIAVTHIDTDKDEWRLALQDGSQSVYDDVILCTSHQVDALWPIAPARFKTIRGQVSYVKSTSASEAWQQALCHQGYLTPAINGLHPVGATFNLSDKSETPFQEEDSENITLLKNELPDHWQALGGEQLEIVESRVRLRCQSTDFLPMAGPAVDENGEPVKGLWLSIAHGSRGITNTPLCADILAADILQLPQPCDNDLINALAPDRFQQRVAKKQSRQHRRRKPAQEER